MSKEATGDDWTRTFIELETSILKDFYEVRGYTLGSNIIEQGLGRRQ